ncbi:hypothetical protein QM646_06515, partial [Rhodococcus erythropolis]|nr:hypothetical protein [Rhodococcus erythropolis]
MPLTYEFLALELLVDLVPYVSAPADADHSALPRCASVTQRPHLGWNPRKGERLDLPACVDRPSRSRAGRRVRVPVRSVVRASVDG